jgi:hypothetical protein
MPNSIEWNKLVSFIGYGPSRRAEILFLGLEEKAREGIKNLRARSRFNSIEDLYEAHQTKLGSAGCFNPFSFKNNPVRQWNTASRFALALQGDSEWQNPRHWNQYWRHELGRKNGTTFLMECFPFPRKSRKNKLPGVPPSFTETLWQKRIMVLTHYLRRFPPKIVIAYGVPTKRLVSDLFPIDKEDWKDIERVKHGASMAAMRGRFAGWFLHCLS